VTRNEPVSPFGWTFVRPDAKDALRIDGNQKFLDIFTFLRQSEQHVLSLESQVAGSVQEVCRRAEIMSGYAFAPAKNRLF